MANQLFEHLKSGLCDATKETPETSLLCMGFTKSQMSGPGALLLMLKPNSNVRPRVFWFCKEDSMFYDQGDSTKIKKRDYLKINKDTFKKDKPVHNVKYYIPINESIVSESEDLEKELKDSESR